MEIIFDAKHEIEKLAMRVDDLVKDREEDKQYVTDNIKTIYDRLNELKNIIISGFIISILAGLGGYFLIKLFGG